MLLKLSLLVVHGLQHAVKTHEYLNFIPPLKFKYLGYVVTRGLDLIVYRCEGKEGVTGSDEPGSHHGRRSE